MLISNFDLQGIVFSYLALLVTVIGCELSLSYLTKNYALDCIENNDLVDSEGRVTFNPLRYFDLFGTIIFPLIMLLLQSPILFGWSKTLWLNMQKVVNRHGINLAIALASSGVFFHFFIAFLASCLMTWNPLAQLEGFWQTLVLFNVFFVVIKLCPILPYDGLKILSYIGLKFGSDALMRFYWMLVPYGMIILIILIMTPLKEILLVPASLMLNFLL